MTRGAGAVAVLLLALLVLAGSVGAAVPVGPRLSFVEFSPTPLSFALKSVNPSGGQVELLASGKEPFSRSLPGPTGPPSWSADGEMLAFGGIRVTGSKPHQRLKRQIYLSGPDGGELRPVPRTMGGAHPVLSPDGHTMAFDRGRDRVQRDSRGNAIGRTEDVSIWLIDLRGGPARRLTPWRSGLVMSADSFSPDGSTLAVTRSRENRTPPLFSPPELILMPLDGSTSTVLAVDAEGGVYSPDGSRLAFLRLEKQMAKHHGKHSAGALGGVGEATDLFTIGVSGKGIKRITDTPGAEGSPSWDPSGSRLAFQQLDVEAFLKGRDTSSLIEVNADGSCPRTILVTRQRLLGGVAWQPGPGRATGPIAC